MYRISFKDRTVKLIEDGLAQRIKEQRENTINPIKTFEVGENQYEISSISKIEKIKDTAVHALPAGQRCKGEKSIHREIYIQYRKRLQQGSTQSWEEFRSAAYDLMYAKQPDRQWCDNRKNTCFCKGSSGVAHVVEMFPGAVVV